MVPANSITSAAPLLPTIEAGPSRHSCAGLLFAASVPAPAIAAILRHSDVRVTLTTYAGLVENDRQHLRGELEAALGGPPLTRTAHKHPGRRRD